jgi:hypothetical protein
MSRHVLLTLLLCLIDATFSKVVRYDRESVWSKRLFEVPASSPTPKSNMARLTLAGQGVFQVSYNCRVSTELCNNFKTVVNRALQKITSFIFLNANIKVSMTFRSFCQGKSSCAEKNVLGQASTSALFPAKTTPNATNAYLYAQALVKQLNYDLEVEFAEFDIIADFNADFDYFYDLTLPRQSGQTDMEAIVLHEILHGMGYYSDWTSWSESYNIEGANDFLTPYLIYKDETTVIGFTYLGIFDSLMYEAANNTPLQAYADAIYGFKGFGQDLNGVLASFYKSGSPIEAARSMFRIATSLDGIVMKFQNTSASSLYVATPTNYSGGSSLSHNSQRRYQGTSEFLMTPTAYDVSLNSLRIVMAVHRDAGRVMYGPFGARTLQVMTDIGNTDQKVS